MWLSVCNFPVEVLLVDCLLITSVHPGSGVLVATVLVNCQYSPPGGKIGTSNCMVTHGNGNGYLY